VDVGAADAAVEQVADDRHREPADRAAVLANGQAVEQRLRRALVAAVAGVDDRTGDVPRQQAARPEAGWRTTMASGFMASRLRAVSASVSPLVVPEVDALMLMVPADIRLAAISNDVRVLDS